MPVLIYLTLYKILLIIPINYLTSLKV